MNNKAIQIVGYGCNVFAFVLIGAIFGKMDGPYQTILVIITGIGLYAALYLPAPPYGPRPAIWWAIRGLCVFWSLVVYLGFVAFFQSSISHDGNSVPVWMQNATPFIFAFVPFLPLWFVRHVMDYIGN